jgi:hypothetical protein
LTSRCAAQPVKLSPTRAPRLVEVGCCEILHDPALVEYDDAVCQAPGDAQVVGDQDDGEAVSVPRAGEQVDEVFLGEDVEAARRFVGEQNVWFGGEGAR